MNLFERVVAHVKSFGHAVASKEHELLNEFVKYLRDDEAAIAAFIRGKTEAETTLIRNFIADIAPAPVVETPVAAPAPEPAPAPAPALALALDLAQNR